MRNVSLISVLLFAIVCWCSSAFAQALKQKGVCWVGDRVAVTEKEIMALANNHVNWISQTPFGWMRDPKTSSITMNTKSDRTWWGESDEGIIQTAALAKKQGIRTMLKPHLWVRQGWPGDIEMKSDTAWQRWFTNYEKFILHYAQIAQKTNIEILCIGTELQQTTRREKEWRTLIAKVRNVYKGKLIYAANFHEEYEHIRFWDALDYIGVQAYFPLAKNQNTALNELVKNWAAPLLAIEKIQKKFNRPVIFTEIGYRSDADAAVEPWRWPQHSPEVKISNEAQSNCYEAFFRAVWNKHWMAGAYFWKWYPHGPQRMAEYDFTPQGKPAEKVMAENFRKTK
jgi:hypothetical protein